MKTNLSDLIAALPQEENGPELLSSTEAQERLQAIFADLAYKSVPVHSLHRMWTMGELSTQVALAYASLWIRGLFADVKTRERQAIETNLRVALKMIHRLGYLRGAATKLGQASTCCMRRRLPCISLYCVKSYKANWARTRPIFLQHSTRNRLLLHPSDKCIERLSSPAKRSQ